MQLESVLLVHIRLSTLVQSMRNQYLHLTSQKYLSLDKIPGEKKTNYWSHCWSPQNGKQWICAVKSMSFTVFHIYVLMSITRKWTYLHRTNGERKLVLRNMITVIFYFSNQNHTIINLKKLDVWLNKCLLTTICEEKKKKKSFNMRQVGHFRNIFLFWQAVEITQFFIFFSRSKFK